MESVVEVDAADGEIGSVNAWVQRRDEVGCILLSGVGRMWCAVVLQWGQNQSQRKEREGGWLKRETKRAGAKWRMDRSAWRQQTEFSVVHHDNQLVRAQSAVGGLVPASASAFCCLLGSASISTHATRAQCPPTLPARSSQSPEECEPALTLLGARSKGEGR